MEKTWVIGGFERFKSVWNFDDFWKRSNTFHAFLCFVNAAEQRFPGDPEVEKMSLLRNEMINTNSTFFDGVIGGEGVWSDDYGWCGISCLEARDYLLRVGDRTRANDYLARAERCWEQMRQTGYDATDSARPVPHGCGNVSPERKKTQGYGTKNTVTNTNLMVLSLRLYNAVKGTNPGAAANYLSMAYAQYKWFSTWFLNNYQSEDDGYYLRILPGPYGLIHERPMAKPDYDNQTYPTWKKGWVWTGDQGLMLAALSELLLVRDDLSALQQTNQMPGFDPAAFESSVRDLLVMLSVGVSIYLFGNMDKVLREAPFRCSFGSEYGTDYVGGRGVLLRYVSEKTVQQALGNMFSSRIAATAQAVWNSRDAENQFDSLWNKSNDQAFNQEFVRNWGSGDSTITDWEIDPTSPVAQGVLQANGLDALTAAMRVN
ncbi:MAG TPA: hypothetical protein VF644_08530 [Pyrinomonadaceae bacterium]|jgi:hypothetical protein